ncbi:MAG: 30S ribosomal protein S16 [Deltaproteobacteria bacterium]|nr:30S ribosomal protein S16 [Deltaproteobacteria bacterium]
MAVKLRLARGGAKKHPFYQIVAADSRYARNGRFLERIGYYDPNVDPPLVKVRQDRLAYWLENGAQPTEVVKHLVQKVTVES